jgi:mannose-6-phosphate isomerase-like protein (cupin superfamily)
MHKILKYGAVHDDASKGAEERIIELLGPSTAHGSAQNHSIIRLELAPGACSPAAPHFHKLSEETYVVLAGTADIMITGQMFSIGAGDIVTAGVGEIHQITATGGSDLVALAIMAPGYNTDDVYEAETA